MFSGVGISSDATGRSSWENIHGSIIQSTWFPSIFATSKSSTASDECLQSPFKVLTVTVSILQARFSVQTSLTANINHGPAPNLCV